MKGKNRFTKNEIYQLKNYSLYFSKQLSRDLNYEG